VPVSQISQHLPSPARPALRAAQAAVPQLSGKPARLRPDLGCILLCEPPPDPVLPVADPATPAAPAAVAVVVAPTRASVPISRPPVSIGSRQQALINSDRASAGLPPLGWSAEGFVGAWLAPPSLIGRNRTGEARLAPTTCHPRGGPRNASGRRVARRAGLPSPPLIGRNRKGEDDAPRGGTRNASGLSG